MTAGDRARQRIRSLEAMLESGRDDALLRYSLGTALLAAGDAQGAAGHLAEATRRDPGYSAAWKHLGKALETAGREVDAAEAYRRGIEAAQRRGDVQAAREMAVFLRRLERP